MSTGCFWSLADTEFRGTQDILKRLLLLLLHCVTCRILAPQPRIKPMPTLRWEHSLNHWTTRKVPLKVFMRKGSKIQCVFLFGLKKTRVFPACPVVKNSPANAADMGSIPGLEDPTCRGAPKPVHHNYWAHTSRALAPQEKPLPWEAWAPRLQSSPSCHN